MSNPINISAVALPISAMSNAFSGLFGGSGSDDYSTMRLLNVQMQMLENMSSKIDVIQSGIEFIIENQEEIKQLIETIPSKTVSELYRKDLEGLFVLLREKIEAYAIERAKNKEKANKIFQPIFNEILTIIQVSRAKIFRLDNYLDLPVVSTCLHFELFCMVLAEQPKSLIEVTLRSYRKWIENCLSTELKTKFEGTKSDRNILIESAKKLFTYTKCKSVMENDVPTGAWKNGEPVTMLYTEHAISFNVFNYKLSNKLSDELSNSTKILIDKSLLKTDDLPSVFEIGDVIWNGVYNFDYKGSTPILSNKKPTRISDQFVINESHLDMANSIDCSKVDATNNLPKIAEDTEPLLKQINDNSYLLIMYASLINIANESFQAIDKFLTQPQSLNKDSILSFGYELEKFSRIYNERAVEWVKFIDEKVEQIEDAEQKAKLKALRDQMANLNANEKNILLEYKRLEAEIAENMNEDLLTEILGILGSIGKELERGVQNIGRETEILVQNLGNNLEKAVQDTGKEIERAVNNVGEAVEAAVAFAENQIESWGTTLADAEKRVREGKIIDAIWHIAADPYKHTDENLAIMVQDSSLINNIATATASIYGGPGGAAAYAAWFTYKQTKNLDFALKAGIIAGLTSQGIQFANAMPANGITELTKRTLVTSSIGAVSIAASGGSEEDIINGFLKGAALSMAREYYRSITEMEIEGRSPTEKAIPKLNPEEMQKYMKERFVSVRYDDGTPVYRSFFDETSNEFKVKLYSVSEMPRTISHVGFETDILDSGYLSLAETGVPMQVIARLPYANDMAYFHDIWCEKVAAEGFELGTTGTVVTIIPATIVTVAGSDTPLITQIVEEINKQVSN